MRVQRTIRVRSGGVALAGLLALSAIAAPVASAATFTVSTTADTNDGTCDADCSLREAVLAANAAPGADTILLPAGTYTLSLAGSDDAGAVGDLDITGPVAITGSGIGQTIIQGGTTAATGVDKVFSFNPLGLSGGFAVTLSDLTVRYGRNLSSYASGNGVGGCLDFDAGSPGGGSLTLTNVTVTDCRTTNGDGGAIAVYLAAGGSVSLTGSTVANSVAHRSSGAAVGGGMLIGCGADATVALRQTTISGNSALDPGATGGGLHVMAPCASSSVTYALHNVTVSGNVAAGDGGGVYSKAPLTIDDAGGPTAIAGNVSGRSGGGLWLDHANRSSSISGVSITGNTAADGGGGIRLDSAATGALTLVGSRVARNTAGAGRATGLSVHNGSATATNTWWGCSAGPAAAPCDTVQVDPASGGTAAGTGSAVASPWLRVTTTASAVSAVTGEPVLVTASVARNSAGQDVPAAAEVLRGLPVAWSASGGSLSDAQGVIGGGGTASATFAGEAGATYLVAAKVDNDAVGAGSNVVAVGVDRASSTTEITDDDPDPSIAGSPVTVAYAVSAAAPGRGTPTGSVTVTDGVDSCTGTVADGLCTLTLTTEGARTLTATYAGDPAFTASTSAGAPHDVVAYDPPPAVSVDQAAGQADPAAAGPIHFTVVFSESVTGFDAGDVAVSGSAAATTAVVAELAPNDGTTYDVAVDDMTVDGTVIVSIAAGAAQDAGGNASGASTSRDNTVTYAAPDEPPVDPPVDPPAEIPGAAASGGGWYRLPDGSRVAFAFHVRKADSGCQAGCAYRGRLVLVDKAGWRVKGSLTSYTLTAEGVGSAAGTGTLARWDARRHGGDGGWVIVKGGASFKISFADGGTGAKDAFGIVITPASADRMPAPLPNSAPIPLRGGEIRAR
jgi:CSLREA domain-containing protein